MTKLEFIHKAQAIHGDKYDYSLIPDEFHIKDKIEIVCPIHGIFTQLASSHLRGCGCAGCSGLKRLTEQDFIERATEVHNGKYTYEDCGFVSTHKKVKILCPIHGYFYQNAKNHLNGQGCPHCGKDYASNWSKGKYEDFIQESKKRFGDVYEFPNIEEEYKNSHSRITIRCKKCGNEFIKIACDHLTSPGGGCGRCYCNSSVGEKELGSYIVSLVGEEKVIFNDRHTIHGFELDIFIPDKKVAIEYNGLFWHSDYYKDKNYHLEKLEACETRGIRLIQVFEDEYLLNEDIVHGKIAHILHCSTQEEIHIGARECISTGITYKEAETFLNANHIQGASKSTVYLGLHHNNKLVGVMTFTLNDAIKQEWELTRYATLNGYIVSGGAGKLLQYFIKVYKPSSIKSFADRRWSSECLSENMYKQLGFSFDGYTRPDYKYILPGGNVRLHKFSFRKKYLVKKYHVSSDLTETEMTKQLGIKRVYDCGLIRYIWKNRS